MEERLVTKAKDINAPIQKNNLSLFLSGNIMLLKLVGVICRNSSNMRPDNNLH